MKKLFLTALMTAVAALAAGQSKTGSATSADADSSHFRRVEQVADYIDKHYVETPDYLKIDRKSVV